MLYTKHLFPFDTFSTQNPGQQPRPCVQIASNWRRSDPFRLSSYPHILLVRSISSSMSSSQHPPDTPAFTALLDAYARWQNFEHDSVRGTMSVRNVPGYDEQAHLSRRTPAPLAFLLACPLIDLSHLPEDERTCPICTDPYHRLSDRTSDQRVRVAQRLPCGHHLCNQCMFEWLTPFAESNNNSCPFDRRVLFPKFPPVLNTEGIQERLDLADWFATATGRQPVGAERNLTRALKVALVERGLEKQSMN